jgi:uncharacterized membrane protein YphA (DoxX/SURF4 family)
LPDSLVVLPGRSGARSVRVLEREDVVSIGHVPLRLATGAYILNSGLGKWSGDEQTAKYLHDAAITAYPFLKKIDSRRFLRLLSAAEIGLGAALLAPMVPSAVAGLGLTAFSGGLLGMYLRTPGMHHEGSVRPTAAGVALSKDVWMFGIGITLVAEGLLGGRRRRR